AIGAGTAVSGLTSDQRGLPLASPPDIGAFQSQGFTMTTVAGSTPQSSTVNTPFSNPLAVAVTANNPLQPAAGGLVNFAAPTSGTSATLSSPTAAIGSNGQASVTATANTIAGSYSVTATVAGVTTPADFSLTNTPGAAASIAVAAGSPQ